MNARAAQIDFLRWLSANDPKLYAHAMSEARAPRGLGELGFINFIIQAVAAVGSAVMKKKQEKKAAKIQKTAQAKADAEQLRIDRAQALSDALVQVNARRAASGLGPVNAAGQAIPSSSLPMPQALASYAAQAAAITRNYLPYILGGAGLLVAVILFKRKRK